MFYLKAFKKDGSPVTLHVRGGVTQNDFGFFNGEGVFLAEWTSSDSVQITKKLGEVKIENDELSFNFTDPEFKNEIGYDEETGYSSLDGGLWQMVKTNYLDDAGKVNNVLQPNMNMQFMYSGAKNPMMAMPMFAKFFTPALSKLKNSQPQMNSPSSSCK